MGGNQSVEKIGDSVQEYDKRRAIETATLPQRRANSRYGVRTDIDAPAVRRSDERSAIRHCSGSP